MASAFKNFAQATVVGVYGASDTTIQVKGGDGAKFPSPPFNVTWWNATKYPDANKDPNAEISTVTNITGDFLKLVRGAEMSLATPKNTLGSTYYITQTVTARALDQLISRSIDTDFAIANGHAYFKHLTSLFYRELALNSDGIFIADESDSAITITRPDTGSLAGNAAALNGELYLRDLTTGFWHIIFCEDEGGEPTLLVSDEVYSTVVVTSYPDNTFSGNFAIVNGRAFFRNRTTGDYHQLFVKDDAPGVADWYLSTETFTDASTSFISSAVSLAFTAGDKGDVVVNNDGTMSVTGPVTSVAGKTGDVALVKSDVGLGNVDNTADSVKPISAAQQAALNAKSDLPVALGSLANQAQRTILGRKALALGVPSALTMSEVSQIIGVVTKGFDAFDYGTPLLWVSAADHYAQDGTAIGSLIDRSGNGLSIPVRGGTSATFQSKNGIPGGSIDFPYFTGTTSYPFPDSVSVSSRSFTVIFIGRYENLQQNSMLVSLGRTGAGTDQVNIFAGAGCAGYKTYYNSLGYSAQATGMPQSSDLCMMALTSSGTAQVFYDQQNSASFGAAPAGTLTGGVIGEAYNAGNYFYGQLVHCVIYGTVLTAAQINEIRAKIRHHYLPQFFNEQWTLAGCGDSIMRGYLSGNRHWIRTLQAALPITPRSYNYSQESATIASFPGNPDSALTGYGKKICFVHLGTNDIAGGATGATVEGQLNTFCAARRSAGWQKVFVLTPLVRSGLTGGQETQRQALRTLLLSNWRTYSDGVVDVGGDPRLATYSDTNMFVDGIHPTANGHSIIAELCYKALIDSMGVSVLKYKAGALTDADFATPIDGLVGYNATAHKIMVRDAGSWLSTAALT